MNLSHTEKLKQLKELFPEALGDNGKLDLQKLIYILNISSESEIEKPSLCWSFNQAVFENNPFPCWIVDQETMNFLEVNDAAIQHYGYSREEFLSMSLKEIRPAEEIPKLIDSFKFHESKHLTNQYYRHLKKGGELITVEVSSFLFDYYGRKARFGQIKDVSQLIEMENQIENQDFWLVESQRAGKIGYYSFDIINQTYTSSLSLDEIFGFEHHNPKKTIDWIEIIHPDDKNLVMNHLKEVLQYKRRFELEYRIVQPNRKTIWLSGHGSLILNVDKVPIKMIGTIQDITERKESELERVEIERRIKKSEEQLKEAQKTAKIGHWELNLASGSLEWSDEIYNIFEIDQKQFKPSYESFLNHIHPDDRDAVNKAYISSLEMKESYNIDHRLLMPDGRIKYVTERCVTEYNENGKATVSRGTVQDITLRKLAEEQSLRNYELYESVLKVSPDLTIITDLNLNVLMVSENTYSTFNIDRSVNINGINIIDFVDPSDKERALKLAKDRMNGVKIGTPEYKIIVGNKDIRHVEVNADFIRDKNGNPAQIMFVLRDITQRKEIENENNIITDKYKDLFEFAPIGNFEVDAEGRVSSVNRTVCEMIGYSKEEIIGVHCWSFSVNPDKMRIDTLSKFNKKNTSYNTFEDELRKKDGSIINILISYKPIIDNLGKTIGFRSSMQDITSLKNAELKLKESEAHFRSITETSLDSILTINSKGSIVYLNKSTERMLGYDYDELINIPITRIIPKSYLSSNVTKIARLSDYNNANITGNQTELICKAKNGKKIPVEIAFSKWDNKGKEYTTVIIRDISKRAQLAKQYKVLFSEMLDGFALYELINDEDGNTIDLRYIVINNSYEKLTHLKGSKIIGKRFSEVNPDSSNKRIATYANVAKTGKPITLEDNPIILGRHFQITIYSPGDNQIATIITDVTARKEAEQVLKENQLSLAKKVQERTEELEKISVFNKTIIDHADIAIISTNRKGGIVSINPFAERLLGYKSSEVLNKASLVDIFKEDDLKSLENGAKFNFRNLTKRVLSQKVVEEIIIRNRNGKSIPLLVSYNILRNKNGRIEGFVLVSTDITSLKNSEESLKKSQNELLIRESYLLAMVENHPGRFWMKDKDGKFIFSNERNNKFVRLTTGFHKSLIGEKVQDIFNKQEALSLLKMDVEIINSKRSFIKEIEQIVGNRAITFERHNFPVISQSGEVIGVAGFATDITERKIQEAQLRMQSEAFESFSMSLVISDVDGNILWANQAFERLTGYSLKEIIGKSTNILKSGLMSDEFFVTLWNTIKSGQVWNGEFINRRKDGSLYYEESTITPIRDDKGQISRFIAIKIDITHRKEIEKALKLSEERWQFAIEASGEGVWDYNYATDVEFFSKRWKEMLGYEEDEISTNKSEWESRVHPDDWPQSLHDMQMHLDGKTPFYINEHRMLCKDGSYKWMLSRGKLIERDENGAPLRMIGTQTDISEIKNLEESLKQNIEKEKELNEMKSRFVSTASHEFRTPLASILITTDSLLNYWTKLGEDQIFSKFEKIRSNVVHLTNIVSDVLQISKIQEGKIEIKPKKIDIIELCQEIIMGFREENSRFTIELQTVFNTFTMYLDERLIRQALNNLISNAIKYSPNSDRIDIIIDHTMSEVVISVIDQGIGIPNADQKNLFTPFYRASNTRHIQGNGLGLNIIRESMKLHGGELTFKSVENEGSRFTLHLPMKISLLKPDSELQ